MSKKKKKKLTKLEQTKYANKELAHQVFLDSLKVKSNVFKPKKGKGSYTRKNKHKNMEEE